MSHLFCHEVQDKESGLTKVITGSLGLRCLLQSLNEKMENSEMIHVNDTLPLKVWNYVLGEDDQQLRMKIMTTALCTLRKKAEIGVVDVANIQVVESTGCIEAPRMHPAEMLSVTPGTMTSSSSGSTGAERRAQIAQVAGIFLKKASSPKTA